MKIQDLIEKLKNKEIKNIQFEDFNGNDLYTLSDFDIADIDTTEEGLVIRLQLNK